MKIKEGIIIDNKKFKVGVYLRLSKEDDCVNESQSIKNQRDYIINYICENGLELVDEYVDDGVSGTQFERIGFERLIRDIENNRINMVITKDTSRLGRNISQSLYYSTEYFAEKNVRYVAIADNIDTFDKNQNTDMLMFKAFYNEMYVKDISMKIRTVLNSQKRNGKFMGGTAPYGYKRNLPYDKHELIIDEEAQDVIKRIFNLFIGGNGIRKIANLLTHDNVPIPSIHNNLNRGIKSSTFGIWKEKTISDILTNPTYKGDLTQCKEYKVSYKSKKRKKNNKNDWIIAKNSCPAIIDSEIFDLVQNIYSKNKNRSLKSKEYLLRGFLICKECGHTISIDEIKWKTKRDIKIKKICYCNYYKKYSKYNACTPHKIDYDELENNILNDIRNKCKNYLKTDNFIDILMSNDKITKFIKELEKKIVQNKTTITQQKMYIDIIYNDKLCGLIDEELFKRQYANIVNKIKNLKQELSILNKKLKKVNNNLSKCEGPNYQKLINDFLSFKKPNKKLLASLIDKIEIDENQSVYIYYKFKLHNY